MTLRPSRLLTRLAGTPRLVLAALLLVAGAVGVVAAASPPTTTAVVVTARALAAGHVLATADLRLRSLPAADVPDRAVRTLAASTGHRTVGAVAAGEVLTAPRLISAAAGEVNGVGRATVAVPVTPATSRIVTPGDRVEVTVPRAGTDPARPGDIPTSHDGGDPLPVPAVLASAAGVLAVWSGSADGQGGGYEDSATVVLDVTVDEAMALSVLPADTAVGLVRRGP